MILPLNRSKEWSFTGSTFIMQNTFWLQWPFCLTRRRGQSNDWEEAHLYPNKKQNSNSIKRTNSMIWWKHLLSHSQPSFTSRFSTSVILPPVTNTIKFLRNHMSGLTTSESCGSNHVSVLDNVLQSVSKCNAAQCSLKGGKKMGQGRGQWQVVMRDRGIDEVEWNECNKKDGILFSHALTATYWKYSLPLADGFCKVNSQLAKKKDKCSSVTNLRVMCSVTESVRSTEFTS